MEIKLEWTNRSAVLRRLKALAKANEIASIHLFNESQKIMTRAKSETPVETGYLRESGYVEEPKVTSIGSSLSVGFGAEYAKFVHENTHARHSVGKAKFLVDPVNQMAPTIIRLVGIRTYADLLRNKKPLKVKLHPSTEEEALARARPRLMLRRAIRRMRRSR